MLFYLPDEWNTRYLWTYILSDEAVVVNIQIFTNSHTRSKGSICKDIPETGKLKTYIDFTAVVFFEFEICGRVFTADDNYYAKVTQKSTIGLIVNIKSRQLCCYFV